MKQRSEKERLGWVYTLTLSFSSHHRNIVTTSAITVLLLTDLTNPAATDLIPDTAHVTKTHPTDLHHLTTPTEALGEIIKHRLDILPDLHPAGDPTYTTNVSADIPSEANRSTDAAHTPVKSQTSQSSSYW